MESTSANSWHFVSFVCHKNLTILSADKNHIKSVNISRFLFFICLEQEPDLENVVSSTLVWPPGTLFLPTFTTITDTSTFREWLKNVLFDHAYHWLLLALLDVSYSGALQIRVDWLIDWLIHWLALDDSPTASGRAFSQKLMQCYCSGRSSTLRVNVLIIIKVTYSVTWWV